MRGHSPPPRSPPTFFVVGGRRTRRRRRGLGAVAGAAARRQRCSPPALVRHCARRRQGGGPPPANLSVEGVPCGRAVFGIRPLLPGGPVQGRKSEPSRTTVVMVVDVVAAGIDKFYSVDCKCYWRLRLSDGVRWMLKKGSLMWDFVVVVVEWLMVQCSLLKILSCIDTTI